MTTEPTTSDFLTTVLITTIDNASVSSTKSKRNLIATELADNANKHLDYVSM